MTAQTYSPITTVKTPNGSTVQDTWTLSSEDIKLSSSELASLKKYLNDNYNGATLIDAPSFKYNCHAYAWHVSEGGNKVWIGRQNIKAEDVYWTDGSYIEVPENVATKVSYHESGNHSAIRLSNEWYQSKWGRNALVKHHPNDVPSGYNPTMPKKFYKKLPKMSIIGQTFICNFEDYYVSGLPAGATVNWTYTPEYTDITPRIQQNTPSANSCTVNNTYSQIFGGYLNAEIVISGKKVNTISKTIRGDSEDFIGFYWQPSSDGSFVPDMSISLDEPNIAIPPNDVIIESDSFRGKRISCSSLGHTSIITSSASNRVNFEMPDLPNGELLTIRVDGSDCSGPITFTFESQNYYKSQSAINLKITSMEANCYNISPDWIKITGDVADYSDQTPLPVSDVHKWSIKVHNAMNSQKVLEHNVVGDSYVLNMTSLNPGIYVVSAIIGDKVCTGKICKQ